VAGRVWLVAGSACVCGVDGAAAVRAGAALGRRLLDRGGWVLAGPKGAGHNRGHCAKNGVAGRAPLAGAGAVCAIHDHSGADQQRPPRKAANTGSSE
jgi:hypothetical protein